MNSQQPVSARALKRSMTSGAHWLELIEATPVME
jgi:hypothetical protein